MGKFLARCSVLFDSVVNLNFILLAKHSAKKNHSRNLHCSRNLMDARFRRCYARVSVSFGLGTEDTSETGAGDRRSFPMRL